MNQPKVDGVMYEVLKLRDTINRISNGFSEIGPVFGDVSLPLPKLQPSELGFIRVVSWLYVHYFEVGKLGTEFLGTQCESASLDFFQLRSHRERVQQLRTYCQHNLNFTDEHSIGIQGSCELWFKEKCGTRLPDHEAHWQKLLEILVDNALHYFQSLEKIIRFIESHAAFDQILEQWQLRIRRFFPAHKFDKVVEEVAADWGRESFDATKFRKRHYDKWRTAFEFRTDEIDFEREARKLVEAAMLADHQNLLPIDGRDIMAHFDIAPGSAVKELLQLARNLYSTKPCTREQLLEALSAQKEQSQAEAKSA